MRGGVKARLGWILKLQLQVICFCIGGFTRNTGQHKKPEIKLSWELLRVNKLQGFKAYVKFCLKV